MGKKQFMRNNYQFVDNMLVNDATFLDYLNRYKWGRRGSRFVSDLGFNIRYTILSNRNTSEPFVYIFMIDFKKAKIKKVLTFRQNLFLLNNLILIVFGGGYMKKQFLNLGQILRLAQ